MYLYVFQLRREMIEQREGETTLKVKTHLDNMVKLTYFNIKNRY